MFRGNWGQKRGETSACAIEGRGNFFQILEAWPRGMGGDRTPVKQWVVARAFLREANPARILSRFAAAVTGMLFPAAQAGYGARSE